MSLSNGKYVSVSLLSAALLAGVYAGTAAMAETATEKKIAIHKALRDIYTQQKRKEVAGEYAALIALEPNDAQNHYEYGMWLLRGEQLKAAVGQFQAATKIQPRNADYLAGLGMAYLH
ncbi:MAG TPA: hypothetical protein V6C72_16895, partial [Chroococcales cyanobacterium]